MRKKILMACLCAVCFVGGCVTKQTAVSPVVDPSIERAMLQKDIAAMAVNLQALDRIRQGQIKEAASLLETVLDGQVVVVSVESAKHSDLEPSSQTLLQGARDYRKRYPQGSNTTSPAMKKIVREILSNVK